jgi:predicted small lipoprotein YifL
VSRTFDRALVRFAVIGALAAALGLAACGRKAGLDPPPAVTAVPVTAAPAGDASAPAHVGPGEDQDIQPVAAATSQRKSFFLDWLLN